MLDHSSHFSECIIIELKLIKYYYFLLLYYLINFIVKAWTENDYFEITIVIKYSLKDLSG